MLNNNSYFLLVDWSNGSTEYIESKSKSDCQRRFNTYQNIVGIENIRVLKNPKKSYAWSKSNNSEETDWISDSSRDWT